MKKSVLLLLSLILAEHGLSCMCQHPFTYCESMQLESADLVVLGYKFTDTYHGMGIKVVQVIDGTENRDTLTVWGDNGLLCRTYCGTFGMGGPLQLEQFQTKRGSSASWLEITGL